MLYATTRSKDDSFTPNRVLTQKRGPDGGLFLPFHIPVYTQADVTAFCGRNFNQNVAELLNLLFNTRLTAYDIDFSVGRAPVRLQQLGQKVLVAECWHNTDWDFERMVRDLAKLVLADKGEEPVCDGWAGIGIRIAVLFGVFGELMRCGLAGEDKKIDVAVVAGDFDRPMAVWYARAMGLPIGNIICCCNENNNLWDFVCHGQLKSDGVARRTVTGDGDFVTPDGLERLIRVYGGCEEVAQYVETLRRGGSYYVDDGFLQRLRQGLYVTVSSQTRILSTIPNVFSTHGYLLVPSSALVYAGLQDYRARTGEMPTALIMAERCPRMEREKVAEILGMESGDLEDYL